MTNATDTNLTDTNATDTNATATNNDPAAAERWWVSDDKQSSVLAGDGDDTDEQCWRALEHGTGLTREEMGGCID